VVRPAASRSDSATWPGGISGTMTTRVSDPLGAAPSDAAALPNEIASSRRKREPRSVTASPGAARGGDTNAIEGGASSTAT